MKIKKYKKELLLLLIPSFLMVLTSLLFIHYVILPFPDNALSKEFLLKIFAVFGTLYLNLDFYLKGFGWFFKKIGWLET